VSSGNHRHSIRDVNTRSSELTAYIFDWWTEMGKKQPPCVAVVLSGKKSWVFFLLNIYNTVYYIKFSHFGIQKTRFLINGRMNLRCRTPGVPQSSVAGPWYFDRSETSTRAFLRKSDGGFGILMTVAFKWYMGLRGNFVVLGPTYYRIVEHPVNRIEQFQSIWTRKEKTKDTKKKYCMAWNLWMR